MHKSKATDSAAAASTSPPEGSGDSLGSDIEGLDTDVSDGSSSSPFTILKGLQAAPELTRERDLPDRDLRDPFADDEEDEDGSGSGSDGEGAAAAERASGSGWHRGSWWRGVVRSARRGGGGRTESGRAAATERFGDGRDDDSDESEGDEVMDDEEFGDFAMPEVGGAAAAVEAASPSAASPGEGGNREGKAADAGGGGIVTGIDPARAKDLVKPLALHPAANKTSASPFGSLWPFSTQGFGSSGKEKEKEKGASSAPSKETAAAAGDINDPVTTEPLELETGEGVLSEDGKKIDRAVEATRRTSIEDPDEDDVDVGKEILVGRGGLS